MGFGRLWLDICDYLTFYFGSRNSGTMVHQLQACHFDGYPDLYTLLRVVTYTPAQTYNLATIPRNYSSQPDCTSRTDWSMNSCIIVLGKIKALRPMTVRCVNAMVLIYS